MKKKYILIVGILIFIISILNISKTQQNWIIEGNKVYIDNNLAYISAEPHTLYGDGEVVFNITSKIYEGDIDIFFGFDKNSITPKKVEFYNLSNVNIEKNYTCLTDYFNYSVIDKFAWCFKNDTINNITGETDLTLIFSHSFDVGDLDNKRIFWNEIIVQEWQDISKIFNKVNLIYGDMNTWYYYDKFSIISNQIYTIKVYIEVDNFEKNKQKYWVAIKPSTLTIQEAIDTNNFLYLDPWWSGVQPEAYWKMNEINLGSNLSDSSGNNKEANISLINSNFIAGKLNNALDFSQDLSLNFTVSDELQPNISMIDWSIGFWINLSSEINGTERGVIISKTDHTSYRGWWMGKTSSPNDANLTWYGYDDLDNTICNILTPDLNDNQFHRVIFTMDYEGSIDNLKVYIDGYLNNSVGCSAYTNFSGDNSLFIIGRSFDGAYLPPDDVKLAINGTVDDLFIYNITLTETDVLTDWNNGIGRELDTSLYLDLEIIIPQNTTYNLNNIDLDFNVTGLNLDTCNFTLDNWATSTQLNYFNNTYFNYHNTSMLEGQYTVNFWCNDTFDTINNTENVTFIIDLENPNLTIESPSTSEISRTNINLTIFTGDNFDLSYCNFTIMRGASEEVGNTQIENCLNITFDVTSDADYVVYTTTNDTANNINNTQKSFNVNTGTPSVSPSGGGGVTIISENLTWSMSTSTYQKEYNLIMDKGEEREEGIIFKNLANEEVVVKLSCEKVGVNDLCEFFKLEKELVILPPSTAIETLIKFTLTLPDNIENGVYYFNIVGEDQKGGKGKLSVKVNVGGIISRYLSHIKGDIVLDLSFISEKAKPLNIPKYLIIIILNIITFLLFYLLIFRKIEIRVGLSFLISFVITWLGLIWFV